MSATVSTDFLLRVAQATPEQQAAIERILADRPLAAESRRAPGALSDQLPGDESFQKVTKTGSEYVFRKMGRRWEVVCEGWRAFRLQNTLGAKYLDYLLHEPNEPIRAFDLEIEVQPEKGEARSRNSTQPEADPKAKREYQQTLGRLKAERADAQAVGDLGKVECLDSEIEALETALKGGGAADTGERARDNVRKAVAVVMKQLREGGPEERAFAEHLRRHLSIGHECLYNQAQGRIWA